MDYKSKNEIEIEFSKAYSQADELEKIAGELSSIANSNVENAFELLEKNWKGENAVKFIRKGGNTVIEMLDVADELLKVAKTIRITADLIYKAEKAALNSLF